MKHKCLRLAGSVGFVTLLFGPSAAFAQTAPSLGAAETFAVLSGTASVSNTGPSVLNGDLGTSGVAGISGFGGVAPNNGQFTGVLHNNDAVADQAQLDAITTPVTSALENLQGQGCSDSAGATILGVTTFLPGVHCYTSSLLINGPITLNAQGNPNAVFIFKVGTDLTTAVNSDILLINGAQACNVFWAIGNDSVVQVDSTFVGNSLVFRDFTALTTAHLFGRVLAGRAVVLDTNVVDATVCAALGGGGGGSACPTITTIPSQVIPTLPVNGSVAVGFTIGGSIIPSALVVTATSSNTTLVPPSAMVITAGAGGARVLTIFGADGRTGVTTITVSVTDPILGCTTITTFLLTIGTAVPTLPQWAMIALAVFMALAGFAAMRRRQRI